MTFSSKERAKQKAASRARDEERLAQGEISAADLQKENAHFARALSGRKGPLRVGFPIRGKPGERRYVELALNKPSKNDV